MQNVNHVLPSRLYLYVGKRSRIFAKLFALLGFSYVYFFVSVYSDEQFAS